jgi:hypothetical protein
MCDFLRFLYSVQLQHEAIQSSVLTCLGHQILQAGDWPLPFCIQEHTSIYQRYTSNTDRLVLKQTSLMFTD